MDKENNIDDLLKLLKDSYGEDAETSREETDVHAESKPEDISSDSLQKQLRDRFSDGSDAEEKKDPERDEFTYTIDDDFLAEAVEDSDGEAAINEIAALVEDLPAEEESIYEELAEDSEVEELVAEESFEEEIFEEDAPDEEMLDDETPDEEILNELEADAIDDDEPPFDVVDDEPPFDVITDEDDEPDEALPELVEESDDNDVLLSEEAQPEYAEDDRFNYRQESEDSAFSFFGDGFEEEIEEETDDDIEEDIEEDIEDDLVEEQPDDMEPVEEESETIEYSAEDEVAEEYEDDDEGVFVEDEDGNIVFVNSAGVVVENVSYSEDEDDETVFSESLEELSDTEPIQETEEIEEIEEIEEAESEDISEESETDISEAEQPVGEIIRVPSKFKTLITGYDASEEKYDKYVTPVEEETAEALDESADAVESEDVDLGQYFSSSDGQLAMFEESATEDAEALSYSEESSPEERDSQIALDFDASERARISKVLSDAPISEIDDSMLALLLEVEDREVLADSVDAEKMERFISEGDKDSERIDAAEAFAFDGAEYENYEQTEEVFDAYSKERTFTLIRVIGCGLFTTLIVILELLRFIGVEFEGILDYTVYPFIYSVISVQLLVFCALFAWRELLRGFKRAFTYNVSNWSAVSIVLGFTVIYSFICAFMGLEYHSHVFCSISALYILFGLITEYVSVCREIKSFRIYASDKNKFTFNTDPRTIQSAEKMHRGGISEKSRIFEPAEIQFPSGYFSAVNSERVYERSLHVSVAMIVAMSVVVLLINVIMGGSAEMSMAMFMVALAALAPISSLAYHTFPIYKLSSKLYRREIAVAGEKMAQKYAQCEYVVLSDMHLFKRATPHNNGIFICNDEKTDTIIEYLDALYSAIGGPMRDMFSNGTPSTHTVKLRRIAKDGIEAAIDTTHSVLLGNAEFLKRYGVYIGDMTPSKKGEGILGFAIDGMPAAKLCVRYETEPLFEMLADRLAENGIVCAIETYDPAINSRFAAECRDKDAVPVNVIHKNATDYYSSSKVYRKETTGMVVCSSRLKLLEAVIWCKHISRIWKICTIFQYIMYGLIFAGAVAVSILGWGEYVNQYTVLFAQLVAMLPTVIAMLAGFPDKDYFSLETDQGND